MCTRIQPGHCTPRRLTHLEVLAMADVIVFHHAQGLTSGVEEFASRIRAAGHQVETPDLYEGKTFATLPDGIAYADETGFPTIAERGRAAAEGRPADMVYIGFSL